MHHDLLQFTYIFDIIIFKIRHFLFKFFFHQRFSNVWDFGPRSGSPSIRDGKKEKRNCVAMASSNPNCKRRCRTLTCNFVQQLCSHLAKFSKNSFIWKQFQQLILNKTFDARIDSPEKRVFNAAAADGADSRISKNIVKFFLLISIISFEIE